MQYCPLCKVRIAGSKRCCPLCKGKLEGEPEPESEMFPQVVAPHRRAQIARRIVTLCVVAVVLCCLQVESVWHPASKWPYFVIAYSPVRLVVYPDWHFQAQAADAEFDSAGLAVLCAIGAVGCRHRMERLVCWMGRAHPAHRNGWCARAAQTYPACPYGGCGWVDRCAGRSGMAAAARAGVAGSGPGRLAQHDLCHWLLCDLGRVAAVFPPIYA